MPSPKIKHQSLPAPNNVAAPPRADFLPFPLFDEEYGLSIQAVIAISVTLSLWLAIAYIFWRSIPFEGTLDILTWMLVVLAGSLPPIFGYLFCISLFCHYAYGWCVRRTAGRP